MLWRNHAYDTALCMMHLVIEMSDVCPCLGYRVTPRPFHRRFKVGPLLHILRCRLEPVASGLSRFVSFGEIRLAAAVVACSVDS